MMPKTNRSASHSTPNDNVNLYGTSKQLPILMMLDVSPSMQLCNRIEDQNIAIRTFLESLCRIDKVRKSARVAFYLFTKTLQYHTDFMPLDNLRFSTSPYLAGIDQREINYYEDKQNKQFKLNVPQFQAGNNDGTDIPYAVTSAIEITRTYVNSITLDKKSHYVPFIVITSDGNPDLNSYSPEQRSGHLQSTQEAAQFVNKVCSKRTAISDMIIPFFIGVGDADEQYLRSFCKDFSESVQMVHQENEQLINGEYLSFANISEYLAQSIAQSIVMNSTSEKLLDTLTKLIQTLKKSFQSQRTAL